MLRLSILLLISVLSVPFCNGQAASTVVPPKGSPVALHGQLIVKGTKILDESDKIVQLHGMSFFWSQWMGQYYTAETVSWLASDWKCSVIRAAMGVEHGGYLQNPEKEKTKVFTLIDAAIKEGLYILVDWHDHHAEKHEDEARKFFAEVAMKYGQYPNVIYEVYNEPLDVSWSNTIKPYSESVIKAIREHDPDNIIACGSRQWSQRVDEVAQDPIEEKNIVYSLHYYASTHKDDLRDIAMRAIQEGIPIFVTEFGVTESNGDGFIDLDEARRWWNFMDQHDISWCNWSIADKKENSAALKPGAPATGWTDEMLTPSGKLMREELRKRAMQ